MKPRKALKWRWIDAVELDGRISAGHRFVLAAAVKRYVHSTGDALWTKQGVIAAQFTLSERSVREAIRVARQLGYFRLEQRRRGGTKADRNVLEVPAESAGVERDEYRQDLTKVPAESAESTGKICTKHRQDPPVLPALEQGEQPLKVLIEGSIEGIREGSATPGDAARSLSDPLELSESTVATDGQLEREADASRRRGAPPPPLPAPHPGREPNKYCAAHMPKGEWEKCRDCKAHYKAHKLWQEDMADRKKRAVEYRLWAIDNCDECDHNGKREVRENLLENCKHQSSTQPRQERQA